MCVCAGENIDRLWRPIPTPLFAVPTGDFVCPSLKNRASGTTSNHLKMPRSCRKIVGWDTFFGAENALRKMCTGLPEKRAPPGRLGGLGLAFRQDAWLTKPGKNFFQIFSEKKSRRRRPVPTPLFAVPTGDFACPSLKKHASEMTSKLQDCTAKSSDGTGFSGPKNAFKKCARASQKSEHLPAGWAAWA